MLYNQLRFINWQPGTNKFKNGDFRSKKYSQFSFTYFLDKMIIFPILFIFLTFNYTYEKTLYSKRLYL